MDVLSDQPLVIAALYLLFALCFLALRFYPIWNSRDQGCDAYNILLCAEVLRSNPRLPIVLPPVFILEEREQWYPPGFLVLCALLPKAWLVKNYWMLNHLIDLVHISLAFALSVYLQQPLAGLGLILIYGMMPSLVQEYASLNTRPLGMLLLSGFLIAVYLSTLYGFMFGIAILLAILLFYSHKLSLQQLWFTLPCLSILTADWVWLAWLPGLYLCAFIIWPRGFIRICQGHVAIIRFWDRYWPLLGAHMVRQSPIYGDGVTRNDYYSPPYRQQVITFFKDALHQNYFLLPALFVLVEKSLLDLTDQFLFAWMISVYLAAIVITLVPILRGIGLGRQYIKFAILPTALVILLNLQQGSIILHGLLLLALLLEIRQYLLVSRNLRAVDSGQLGRVSDDLDQLLAGLQGSDNRLMCLPTHLCDLVAYRYRIRTYWGTHSHCFDEKLADFFPVLQKRIEAYALQDQLTHLLLDSRYLDASEIGLAESYKLDQCGHYVLYSLSQFQ